MAACRTTTANVTFAVDIDLRPADAAIRRLFESYDRAETIDGINSAALRGQRVVPLASLHANPHASVLRRARHFDEALGRLDLRARNEMADALAEAPPGAAVFRLGLEGVTETENWLAEAYRQTLWSVR